MSDEIMYSLIGIVILIFIILAVLKNGATSQVQTKEEKRKEIINSYKKELREALEPLKNDKQKRMSKKSELLKQFSNELSRNIFFDASEIKEIILKLSQI
ncbi:MAG: hypothetical protein U9N02_05965 [Campylobacterota bacterium]|nr:hypothetical protein [Campylobacterota bacterium]